MTLSIDGSPVVVVPKEPTEPMRIAFCREAGQTPAYLVRAEAHWSAMIAAASPEPLAAVLEMREALDGLLRWYGVDTDGHHRRRAEAILSRVTVTGETSDAG